MLKLCVVGNSKVGKTSLIDSYANNKKININNIN